MATKKKTTKRSGPVLEIRPMSVAELFEEIATNVAVQGWRWFDKTDLASMEARHGDPSRAVAAFRAALDAKDPYTLPTSYAAAARAIAERGEAFASVAREMLAVAESVPVEHLDLATRAAVRVHVALAHEALGEGAKALAIVEQAIATVPEWTTVPDSPYAPTTREGGAAALAAGVLVRHGRRELAFQVIRAIRGAFGVEALMVDAATKGDLELTMLVAGTYRDVTYAHLNAARAALDAKHFAIVDALLPVIATSPYLQSFEVAPLRMLGRIRGASTDAVLAEIDTALEAEDAPARVAAMTTAIDACREAGLVGPARTLGERFVASPVDLPPLQTHLAWRATVAEACAGADIRPQLARTTTDEARMMLATYLLEAGVERSAAVELASAIDVGKIVENRAGAAARLAHQLAKAGDTERATALFDAAVAAAGTARFALVEIASAQAATELHDAAWATVQHAKKSERTNVVADFAAALGRARRADVLGGVFRVFGYGVPLPILNGLRAWPNAVG